MAYNLHLDWTMHFHYVTPIGNTNISPSKFPLLREFCSLPLDIVHPYETNFLPILCIS